jgi:hypothetical protein
VNETYYAGAYWGPRKESPRECARRLEVLLTRLAQEEQSFTRWFQQGKSRKDAQTRPIEPQPTALEEFIRRGKDRTFDDLGFSVAGWNGASDEEDACGFLIACGGDSEWVNNRCVFTLPGRGPNADRVLTTPVLGGLVRSMALAWEPDWGVAMSEPHRDLVKPGRAKGAPYVGWVTYLARHRGTVPPLPAPVRVEQVEDLGSLIILTPERFTASHPEHIALAHRVRELLEGAGLLQPPQPHAQV